MNKLKSDARAALIGNYGVIIFSILMVELFLSIIVYIFTKQNASPVITILSSIIITLLGSVLETGIQLQYLKAARGESTSPSDVLACFNMHPDKVVLLTVAVGGLELLMALPVILARIMTAPGELLPYFLKQSALQTAGILLVSLLWTLLIASVLLHFVMVYYLYLDHPEKEVLDFLKESSEIMEGQRLRYALLFLSFAGYWILGVLTFGLAFLWIVPYMEETFAMFYLRITQPAPQKQSEQ